MFGRRVTVLLRLPAHARLPTPTPFHCQHDLPARTLTHQSRRTYATPGRPRKAVGEPSRPVKRAVKRSAATATSSDSPAKQKNEAKKEKAAKKPVAKKTAAKKPVVKKAAAPKALTEAQKAAKMAKLEKAMIADLKKTALNPPKIGPNSAYEVFVIEKAKDLKGVSGENNAIRQKLAEHARSVGAQWKELSPADIEHYNHAFHTAREASEAEYKRWVKSHTPEEIMRANQARTQLRRKTERANKKKKPWPAIHDERAVKRATNSYSQFVVNRHASGDFKNIPFVERAKLISQEWKALNEGEKEKYKNLHNEDKKRYTDEYSSVYGHLPPSYINGSHQPQAAAAAAA